jgi:D-xylose transport system permease protein
MSDIIGTNPEPDVSAPGSTSAASVEVPEYIQRQSFGQMLRNDLGFIPVLFTLLAIVAFFAIISNGVFLEPQNLSDLVLQIAQFGILGLGVVLVLLLGEIDLSVAAVSTLCSVVMAVLSERMGASALVAILLALLWSVL